MSRPADDADRAAAALVAVRLDEDQQEWVRLGEDGVLDMPISVVRALSEWLKRYDMRPKQVQKPGHFR